MSIETGKIYNEDCLDTMERMDENEVDLVFTDPPYGIGCGNIERNKSRGDIADPKDYGEGKWDDEKLTINQLESIYRVSKNQIIFGGNYFVDIIDKSSMGWIVWDKNNYDTDFADCELAWTSFDKAVREYEWQWNGMLQEDMKNKEERVHPTQKPTGLIKLILQDWAEEGWTIYDPFTGSGSIPLACEELGYEWIASEKETDYVDKARERIKRERDQRKMF